MPYKLLLGTAIEECTVLPDLHSVHFLKLLKSRNQIIHVALDKCQIQK